MLNGLFDIENRLDYLTENGDILPSLKKLVPWEDFRSDLEVIYDHERKSNAGRRPFDVVLMFKILILQSLYNLSDDEMEYQIMDRLSFMRFLDLDLDSRVPDAKTIWLFRSKLEAFQLTRRLFDRFNGFLAASGFVARKGQMVDATIVRVPIQRNTREENAAIKEGKPPVENWSEAKKRQKDTDARWAKKGNELHYGYKNHVKADAESKLITGYTVTSANVHDSRVLADLVDDDDYVLYADSAYCGEAIFAALPEGLEIQVHEKGSRNRPLTEEQKEHNKEKSRVRVRIEHIFGFMTNSMQGITVRWIGKLRADFNAGITNLVYNICRYEFLKRPCFAMG